MPIAAYFRDPKKVEASIKFAPWYGWTREAALTIKPLWQSTSPIYSL